VRGLKEKKKRREKRDEIGEKEPGGERQLEQSTAGLRPTEVKGKKESRN